MLKSLIDKWLKFGQSLSMLQSCLWCAARCQHGLCQDCLADLPWNTHCCEYCAIPLEASVPSPCGRCQQSANERIHVIAALRYEEPIDILIKRLKFAKHLPIARTLGLLLYDAIRCYDAPLPDRVIPVPLHAQRLRARGFNQATEITRVLAKKLKCPCDTRIAKRVLATQAQATLRGKARARNVKNAFSAQARYPLGHVAIVDDVITTGHTTRALADVLLQAGARRVDCWSVARASLNARVIMPRASLDALGAVPHRDF